MMKINSICSYKIDGAKMYYLYQLHIYAHMHSKTSKKNCQTNNKITCGFKRMKLTMIQNNRVSNKTKT